jgi:DNA processing protein
VTDDSRYWLGFSLVPEIGPRRIAMLCEHFDSLADAWGAPEQALRYAGLDGIALKNLLVARKRFDLQAEYERVQKAGAHLISLNDDRYPALLKPLPDAPPILYVKGDLTPADAKAVTVVGTRKASHYGRTAAYQLSKELASQGVTIISGLAQGIDAAAHQGALDAGGRTIAVLGCGIDRLYPREHEELARKITQHGALVSEFRLTTPPEARNFPRRNRVLSGMSLGVLIAEAPEKSGALITALFAAEQSREIFAVPGSIFTAAGTGTNRLIQDGAKLVISAADILNELDIAHNRVERHIRIAETLARPDTDQEAILMQHMDSEPIHIDDLARMAGLPVAVVSSALTMLELKGLAQNVGHMQYCLKS